ncbi:MAG: phosphoglycerate kinase [Candidatus Moranbacteria bacterium]|nr:phosphoglycerate kinase [Candidatus Moranbacteria bacterium]
MDIRRIQDADLENKKVLLRVDFNVAVENGKVKESFKIAAAKETLDYLLNKNCKVAMITHLGRPDGQVDSKFSVRQIAGDVEDILATGITFVSDCIGEKVKEALEHMVGGALLLENVRFYAGDESNDVEFAKQLAENFDVFVQDAFSVSHRDQASVTGVAKILPSCAGFRMLEEIHEMTIIKEHPVSPAVAIIGGAKIETKIPVIKFFEEKYDHILVGGKIANEALDQNIEFSDKVVLPVDFVDDRLDIGPETVEKFKAIIASAKTIAWNGPTGKFEDEKYAKSSNEILEAVIASGAFVLVGGGETLEILEKNHAMDDISFVSTGGGAMLDFLAGNAMPGIEALSRG